MHEDHPALFQRLPKRKRRSKRPQTVEELQNPLEEFEQERVCDWLDAHKIPYHSIPNDLRTEFDIANMPVKRSKMHRIGLKPGVPDLFICRASGLFHGLYIEMKRKHGGVVSADQKRWIRLLLEEGYLAKVCRGADKAIELIEDYFNV